MLGFKEEKVVLARENTEIRGKHFFTQRNFSKSKRNFLRSTRRTSA